MFLNVSQYLFHDNMMVLDIANFVVDISYQSSYDQ